MTILAIIVTILIGDWFAMLYPVIFGGSVGFLLALLDMPTPLSRHAEYVAIHRRVKANDASIAELSAKETEMEMRFVAVPTSLRDVQANARLLCKYERVMFEMETIKDENAPLRESIQEWLDSAETAKGDYVGMV